MKKSFTVVLRGFREEFQNSEYAKALKARVSIPHTALKFRHTPNILYTELLLRPKPYLPKPITLDSMRISRYIGKNMNPINQPASVNVIKCTVTRYRIVIRKQSTSNAKNQYCKIA